MTFLVLEENNLKHVVESLNEVEHSSRTGDSFLQHKPWLSDRKSVSLGKDYNEMQRSLNEQRNGGAWFADVWIFVSTWVASTFRQDIKHHLPLLSSHTLKKYKTS